MNHYTNKKLPFSSHGFSLIEALVAFMIISVGMLGIASLQTVSMKAGHTAITRTSAVFKVEEILDRMRVNTAQIVTYDDGTTPDGANRGCSDVASYSAPNTVATAATVCTPEQLAQDDVFHWKASFVPNMTATIDVVPPAAAPLVLNTVTVTMSWTERAVADTNLETANNYTVTVEM